MSASEPARMSERAQALYEAIAEMEVIDCHEHLGPEQGRLDAKVDVFTLFQHYTGADLRLAGMSEAQHNSVLNRDIPLERRWDMFEPFWERIRWDSYARAALIAAKRFFGAEDISRETYVDISEKIQAHNTPGLYERVLGEACNIRKALCCGHTTQLGNPRLLPLIYVLKGFDTWGDLTRMAFNPAEPVRTLDDVLDNMRVELKRIKADGAVGIKMISSPYGPPSREEAASAFARLRDGTEQSLPEVNPLRDYITDETIRFAAEQDMVIAVHTGYWGDFRQLDPLHMIPLIQRHPSARFDIYHLGYPWVREALMLGKGFPNVWLNLCWTHIISQRFAMAALAEAIDLLPTNKLLAFGGDYHLPVEKVYGHLVMAREDVARVLAERVEEGQMTESQALGIARQWFFDNAVELYRLKGL